MIAPFVAHFLISLIFVVSAVSSTAQWKTLRPADIVVLDKDKSATQAIV